MSRSAVTVPGDIRVGFHTFGCKLNQFETEALASTFRTQGFAIVPFEQEADAYVVNTCTVTCRTHHKARALIRSLARSRSRALLIVTGCSAELNAGELFRWLAITVPNASVMHSGLVEELSFAALHVFPFSPRPGTAASGLRPAVPERTRHQRARELRALGRLYSSSYARSWIGRDVEVLLEGRERTRAWGVSGNYLLTCGACPPRVWPRAALREHGLPRRTGIAAAISSGSTDIRWFSGLF